MSDCTRRFLDRTGITNSLLDDEGGHVVMDLSVLVVGQTPPDLGGIAMFVSRMASHDPAPGWRMSVYSGPRKLDTKKAIDKLQSNHEKETLTRP